MPAPFGAPLGGASPNAFGPPAQPQFAPLPPQQQRAMMLGTDREGAERLLKMKGGVVDGTFLFRHDTKQNTYALTIWKQDGIKHFRIQYDGRGGFKIQNQDDQFMPLDALAAKYSQPGAHPHLVQPVELTPKEKQLAFPVPAAPGYGNTGVGVAPQGQPQGVPGAMGRAGNTGQWGVGGGNTGMQAGYGGIYENMKLTGRGSNASTAGMLPGVAPPGQTRLNCGPGGCFPGNVGAGRVGMAGGGLF